MKGLLGSLHQGQEVSVEMLQELRGPQKGLQRSQESSFHREAGQAEATLGRLPT